MNESYQIKKKTIKDLFKNELDLLVDKVKSGGSGTSKDGNN